MSDAVLDRIFGGRCAQCGDPAMETAVGPTLLCRGCAERYLSAAVARDYLAERARAIREGFVSDECELCAATDGVTYVHFENEPVAEPLGVFACAHCIADPPRDDEP